jgi:hypothetical protein
MVVGVLVALPQRFLCVLIDLVMNAPESVMRKETGARRVTRIQFYRYIYVSTNVLP